jgi:hypothetical protein
LSLALLAADYGLVRYGGRVLTRREDSRGVRRWRFLRRDLAGIIVLPEPERDGPEMDPEGELPRVFRSGG